MLRYGADDAEVVERLRWMRDVLGPALASALARTGPLDLIALQRRALLEGDECHHRTHAGTQLLHAALADELPARGARLHRRQPPVLPQRGDGGGEGRHGRRGRGARARRWSPWSRATASRSASSSRAPATRWFTGPAALPDPARLEPGYAPEDMQRDLGDSAIVEVYGLGALAIEASPLSAASVGLDAADAPAITARLRQIAAAEHPELGWGDARAILGVDARAVVATGIVPPIHTGIAHRAPGIGQIGGGVTLPPLPAFHAAVGALEAAAATPAG